MKSPAFQFYPDDFLGSPTVARMTHAEIGVYMLLLCFDWNGGGLPSDVKAIARMVKIPPRTFAKMWAVIGGQFVERDGRLFNPRLDKERVKQAEWREKSSVGGKRAAASKAAQASAQVVENQSPEPKGGARVVEPPYQPKGNTPVSSLQSPRKEQTTRAAARSAKADDSFPAPVYDFLEGDWFAKIGKPPKLFRAEIKPVLLKGVRPGQLTRAFSAYAEDLAAKRKAGKQASGKLAWFLEDVAHHIAEGDLCALQLMPPDAFGLTQAEANEKIAAHQERLKVQDDALVQRIMGQVAA